MYKFGIARLVLAVAIALASGAVQAGYDSAWYRAPFWSGEYPSGVGVQSPTTVQIRAEPSLDVSPSIKCELPEGANYHPWNKARVQNDGLEFLSL